MKYHIVMQAFPPPGQDEMVENQFREVLDSEILENVMLDAMFALRDSGTLALARKVRFDITPITSKSAGES